MAKRSSVSRRQFIKGTAALAVASPMIVPASVLGQSQRSDKTVVPPSERLTLGFIGIGKQASGHLDVLSGLPTTQVIAVCDVHTGRRERAKNTTEQKYEKLERQGKGIAQYVDYHELLAHKDIQAVVIGVPDHWHAAPVIDACKAGKDIYCEKPLTLTIHEAKTLIDAVRKYDRVFQTGSQQRSEGPFHQAVEYIRNGRIGKVKEVLVGVGPTSKPCDLPAEETPEGIEWDIWLGQAPQRPYNDVLCRRASEPNNYPFNPGWRDYREYSGGYVTDWGAHHYDITQWALDMDHSGPVEILPPESAGDKYGAKIIYRGSPVGDNIVATHVEKVWEGERTNPQTGEKRHVRETNGILFIGDKGRIFVNREMIVSEPDSILKEPLTDRDKRVFHPTTHSPAGPHRQNWMDCIASRKKPVCDVEIGARSVTVCHLINLAYWNHRRLHWDPQKWEFPGDAQANQWRSRPRRGKYQLPEV